MTARTEPCAECQAILRSAEGGNVESLQEFYQGGNHVCTLGAPAPAPPDNRFDEWAVLELFGHQRIAGRVTNATIGGASFVRVDVPDQANGIRFTKYLNPSAIYSIAPCDEQIARGMAVHCDAEPVHRYELRQLANTRQLPLEGEED